MRFPGLTRFMGHLAAQHCLMMMSVPNSATDDSTLTQSLLCGLTMALWPRWCDSMSDDSTAFIRTFSAYSRRVQVWSNAASLSKMLDTITCQWEVGTEIIALSSRG